MTTERHRGIQVHRPIIYGSHARLLSDAERQLAPAGHTHRWTVFLTSAATPPPANPNGPHGDDMDYLPGGADDLSYLIKRVTFRLHETYPNPSRALDKPPYQVTETGWGEFTVQIRIQFIPESGEKPYNLAHPIKLHHWGAPIEAPPVPPAPTSAVASGSGSTPAPSSSTPAPGAAPKEDKQDQREASEKETSVKLESQTPKAEDVDVSMAEASTSTPAPAPATTDPAQPLQPISIAARYPVHAWQYDELVFCDPSNTFLNILNANTPTPLPPKNRRPRDQREDYERKTGKKKIKARISSVSAAVSRAQSRAGTEVPGAEGDRASAAPVAGGVPAPGQTPVGVPGEPGSADVPLEFSQEMEKAEYNRLNDARIELVNQQDRWREKLIALEKETAKLKEELGLV